jgi:hypothetical protein
MHQKDLQKKEGREKTRFSLPSNFQRNKGFKEE